MKRIIFSFLCLFGAISLFAGNPVTVKSGDVSVLKENTTALLELDFSATRVGNQSIDEYLKSRGDDFVKDFPEDKTQAADMFAVQFNKKSKGINVAKDASNAVYKFVIHVSTLDYGNAGSAFVPFASAKAGGCIIKGTIDIINLKTNQTVCTIDIDDVKGLGHMSDRVRLRLVFFELANKIAKIKK